MEPKYDSKIVEEKIMRFWEENAFFAFSPDSKREIYSIDTPPPTVSGDIHMGHVFSYSQAEFVARYKRMKGFEVFYPFGLDNNGLPTELLIEKKIGKRAESMERERFTEIVRSEIEVYNKKYVELWKRLGLSVDWSLTYQTISSDVQKISQKSFLELNRMGRVYKKEAPVLYCPKCKTTVSQMELADKILPSKMVFVKFDEGVVIATTRPELIPACVAIFVNPEDGKNKELIGRSVKVPIF
ncbi:class I tRNA ligase family protein, partial [Candidatus Marsarchaeota archaeon]|nr:class I tRNA ligase family protein [Candidatus Marsarchaeota archaeon]